MASRIRLPSNDSENVTKQKTTVLQAKTTVLPSKGATKRPVFGDRTNRELPKANNVNNVKPAQRKPPVAVLKVTRPTVLPSKKLTVPPSKPLIKEAKKCDEKEQKIVAPLNNKPKDTKPVSYSVHHFGLVEENDTDPHLVPTYINDIIVHLRNLEPEYLVNEVFLTCHKTTPRMRSVLVNWLVEVHVNFRLVQETLYLCVSIIDRYLQKNKTVGRDNLQLVGTAALFIAAKYEETYAPEVDDLVYVCDDMFPKKKIFQMEHSILKCLEFKLGGPCSLHFLRRYSKVGKVEANHHVLAKYLLELTILDHEYSYIKPSLIAASALCLSVKLLNEDDAHEKITNVVEFISGYNQKHMSLVIKKLAKSVVNSESSKYQAVRSKYAAKNLCSISTRSELKSDFIKKLAGLD